MDFSTKKKTTNILQRISTGTLLGISTEIAHVILPGITLDNLLGIFPEIPPHINPRISPQIQLRPSRISPESIRPGMPTRISPMITSVIFSWDASGDFLRDYVLLGFPQGFLWRLI